MIVVASAAAVETHIETSDYDHATTQSHEPEGQSGN